MSNLGSGSGGGSGQGGGSGRDGPPGGGDPPQGQPQQGQLQQQPPGWGPPPGGVGAFAGGTVGAQPDRTRKMFMIGLSLTIFGCLLGLVLNLKVFIIPLIGTPVFGQVLAAIGKSFFIAYVPVVLYLAVPLVIDRYDPEPWWALLGVFLWGAMFATGVSAVINTALGDIFGQFVASAISAPIFEEATKGLAILGMVVFLHREFDGVVDGIIYGTFVALGFAATENIIYYARNYNTLGEIFVLRGVLTPWLHPLFTAMTGIGFGYAREHGATWAKFVFPALGYLAGVFLHAWWNGLPQIFGPAAFLVNLVVGILMALAFFGLVIGLVLRKGQTIKKHLQVELLSGTITQEEFDLITSYGGRLRARFSWRGKAGAEFVAAGARLALSHWHTARAQKGQKQTISMGRIAPLRQDMARLRKEMKANAGS